MNARFADIAPQLLHNGYTPIPIIAGEKRPAIENWNSINFEHSLHLLKQLCDTHPNASTGILLGNACAFDIDVADEELARLCTDLVTSKFGKVPLRFGNAPKVALMFRVRGAPFKKQVTNAYMVNDQKAQVEILCEGQQLVVFGRHPEAQKPYHWQDGDLLQVPLSQLPEVTEAEAVCLLEEVEQLIASRSSSAKVVQLSNEKHSESQLCTDQNRSAKANEGRNGRLFSIGCGLRARGAKEHEIRDALHSINNQASEQDHVNFSDGPLDDHEVEKILISVMKEKYAPTRTGAFQLEYFETENQLARRTRTNKGLQEKILCNFTAKIVEDICRDNGATEVREYHIQARHSNGSPLPSVRIAANQFNSMNWVPDAFGAKACISVGTSNNQHVAAAIQSLSEPMRRQIYTHTGWRKIFNQWHYLHGQGAINANGPVSSIEVELGSGLEKHQLLHLQNQDMPNAIRATIDLLKVAPAHIIWPLISAVFRSVLSEWVSTELSVFIVGPTGTFKTCLACSVTAHFGNQIAPNSAPAAWSSTANALEGMAFTIKDQVLLIDDFVPTGNSTDVNKLHAKAERIFRAQGNRSGRARMRADSSLAGALPPRGLIIATGEDLPKGQSLQARLIILQTEPGDVNLDQLTVAQTNAESGKFAVTMAGFVQRMAKLADTTDLANRLKARQLKLRIPVGQNSHARTPNNIATLMLGIDEFLDYAVEVGAIQKTERAKLQKDAEAALNEQSRRQNVQVSGTDPASRFVSILAGAINGKKAHIAGLNGYEPANAGSLGWSEREIGDRLVWEHKGDLVGWIDGDNLFLEPEVAISCVKRLAREQGFELLFSNQRIQKCLKEAKLLKESDRDRHTIRKTIGSRRRTVLSMSAREVLGLESTEERSPF